MGEGYAEVGVEAALEGEGVGVPGVAVFGAVGARVAQVLLGAEVHPCGVLPEADDAHGGVERLGAGAQLGDCLAGAKRPVGPELDYDMLQVGYPLPEPWARKWSQPAERSFMGRPEASRTRTPRGSSTISPIMAMGVSISRSARRTTSSGAVNSNS